jgi:DNA-binding GntR family transcriptional regulator
VHQARYKIIKYRARNDDVVAIPGQVSTGDSTGRAPAAGPVAAGGVTIRRRQMLTDETYDALMSLLMSHQIHPGERINIDALARILGVSVTPIRESLARLESEALVTKQAMVGYTATPLLTLEQVSDMYEVRLALEPLAAGQTALRSTHEQVEDIAAAVGEDRDSTTGPGSDEHRRVALDDQRFHAAIAGAARNDFLRDALERLHSHLHLYRLYRNARIVQEATVHEHEAIVEAIRARDSDGAERAMRAHLEASQARLVEVVKASAGTAR